MEVVPERPKHKSKARKSSIPSHALHGKISKCKPKLDIDIVIEYKGWHNLDMNIHEHVELIKDKVSNGLKVAKTNKIMQICLLLTEDTRLHHLNHQYRGQNQSTNVLSFPYIESYHLDNEVALLHEDDNAFNLYDNHAINNVNELSDSDWLTAACKDRKNAAKTMYLGDIAISYHRIHDESTELEKSFKEHFSHILIHGVLHLFGYDHEKDEEATVMENLETKIMKKLKYKDPYAQNLARAMIENYDHDYT